MSRLGEMHYFLGIEVMQCKIGIFKSREVKDLLKKFNMDQCKESSTPMNQGEKFVKEDGSPKVNASNF